MNIIVILLPYSLIPGLGTLIAFIWTLRHDQYSDPAGDAHRLLLEQEDAHGPDTFLFDLTSGLVPQSRHVIAWDGLHTNACCLDQITVPPSDGLQPCDLSIGISGRWARSLWPHSARSPQPS
ncbi:cbb3-type cytochrome oxidase assembly protein CcoS [uncultured Tateyamaria sp.]|uniref:cbb3-type cytochrome oxidase assembly protein CcoS n=1 Tax=uncultured Tateyamaria sp. TaxID=455651 RepID=UPI0034542C0C